MIASSLDYSLSMISLENKINLDSKICIIIIKTLLYCRTISDQRVIVVYNFYYNYSSLLVLNKLSY